MSEAERASLAEEIPGEVSPGRSPLQHMLHALKQPLTGLHCSLELALVGQRTPEQYARTLREGLELAERMSVLVAAIGELVENQEENQEGNQGESHDENREEHQQAHENQRDGRKPVKAGAARREVIALDAMLHQVVDELQPVAGAKLGQILLHCNVPLPVYALRHPLAGALFRFLDSALSLTAPGGDLRIRAHSESGQARLQVRWDAGTEASGIDLCSRPELGLLLAEAGWKRLGGDWSRVRSPEKTGGFHTVIARLPLAAAGNGQTAGSDGNLPAGSSPRGDSQ
ncbi:MAG: hypothetical protein WBQ08_21785 [Candidatus Sulfotelmatobacter sp.]